MAADSYRPITPEAAEQLPEPKAEVIARAQAFVDGDDYLSPLGNETSPVSLEDFNQQMDAVIATPRGSWPYNGGDGQSTMIGVGDEADPQHGDLALLSLVKYPEMEDLPLPAEGRVLLGVGLTTRQAGEMTGKSWQLIRKPAGTLQLAALRYEDGAPVFSHWADPEETAQLNRLILDSAEVAEVNEAAATIRTVRNFLDAYPQQAKGKPAFDIAQNAEAVNSLYDDATMATQVAGSELAVTGEGESVLCRMKMVRDEKSDACASLKIVDRTNDWRLQNFTAPKGKWIVVTDIELSCWPSDGQGQTANWSIVVDNSRLRIVREDPDKPYTFNRLCSDEEIAVLHRIMARMTS